MFTFPQLNVNTDFFLQRLFREEKISYGYTLRVTDKLKIDFYFNKKPVARVEFSSRANSCAESARAVPPTDSEILCKTFDFY